jgi:hypothetical protein
MLLSKVAMDIEAKHTSNGITEWRYHASISFCNLSANDCTVELNR